MLETRALRRAQVSGSFQVEVKLAVDHLWQQQEPRAKLRPKASVSEVFGEKLPPRRANRIQRPATRRRLTAAPGSLRLTMPALLKRWAETE